MINKHAKGMRAELEFKKILESRKFITYKPTWNKYSKNKDIFNLFDIIAVDSKELLLVQIKSNYCPKEVKEQIKKFKVPKNIKKIIAIKVDRKGWIEETYL